MIQQPIEPISDEFKEQFIEFCILNNVEYSNNVYSDGLNTTGIIGKPNDIIEVLNYRNILKDLELLRFTGNKFDFIKKLNLKLNFKSVSHNETKIDKNIQDEIEFYTEYLQQLNLCIKEISDPDKAVKIEIGGTVDIWIDNNEHIKNALLLEKIDTENKLLKLRK